MRRLVLAVFVAAYFAGEIFNVANSVRVDTDTNTSPGSGSDDGYFRLYHRTLI